jgi:hypothetical protein
MPVSITTDKRARVLRRARRVGRDCEFGHRDLL